MKCTSTTHYKTVSEFEDEYLYYDFDGLLFQNNNYLVNSDAHYIKQKNRYIEDTLRNVELYKKLLIMVEDTFPRLDSYKTNVIIRDKKEEDETKKSLKDIVLGQKKLLKNFLHYIQYLNTNKQRYSVDYPNSQNSQSSPSPSIKSVKSTKSVKSVKSTRSVTSITSVTPKTSIKGLFSKLTLTPKRTK